MAYTTPVTDRAQSDITNKTSKGYFNVADWERVYSNSQLVNSLAAVMLGETIVFNTLTAPTTITIESVTNFNTLLANIERMRVQVYEGEILIRDSIATEIKDDYVAGPTQDAPDYVDANLWESTLDAIWDYYNGSSLLVCPTLSGDLTITTGNQEIYVDCLDTADFNIDLQGSANLYII